MLNRALLRLLGLLSVLTTALVCAGVARAEQAVLPSSSSLPWADPNHQTPVEAYASGYVSSLAKRPVRVHCHGAGEWASLGMSPTTLGYVAGAFYNVYTGVIVRTEDVIHLNGERVCMPLKAYGEAAQKVTKCGTTGTVTRTVFDNVQVKKKVFYWITVKTKTGKKKRIRKSKYVWVTKRVPRIVTDEIPGPRVPCYGNQSLPTGYHESTTAVHVLAHEFVHVLDFSIGNVIQSSATYESRAECFGMQLLPQFASAFGADEDDARSMGKYYWENVYPRMPVPYYNPACQPNSSADLTPNDGIWPRRAKPSLDGPVAELQPLLYEASS